MRLIFPVLLILFSLIIKVSLCWEEDQTGIVTHVVDGDTFDVSTGERIRLADIDAPESYEEGGQEATEYLKSLILNKKVYLDIDDVYRYDYEGTGSRLVCVVYVDYSSTKRLNINEKMVREDYAEIKDYENEFNPYTWSLYITTETTPPPPPPPPPPEPPPEPEPPPPPPAPKKEYTLKIQSLGSGTTNPSPATYVHTEGTVIEVKNEPSIGWKLYHWVLDGQTLDQSELITVTMNSDHILTAIFEEKPPNSKIYFKIMDANTNPVKGVTIEALQKPENQAVLILLSDEKGEAQTDNIRSGRYEFKFTKKGYETQSTQITLETDEQLSHTVSIDVTPVNIVIQLRDHEGKPVSHTMISSVSTPAGQEPVTGVTNEDGTFTLHDVYPGNYSFAATGYKILSKTFELSAPLGEQAFFNFTRYTHSVCNLMVRVEDEKGYPVNDVLIESTSCPQDQLVLSEIIDGEKTFYNILSGEYVIRFSKEGYAEAISYYTLAAGYTHETQPIILRQASFFSNYILYALAAASLGVASFLIMKHNPMQYPGKRTTDDGPIIESYPPKFHGTVKGDIIKAVAVEGIHELSDLKVHLGLPHDEFMKAFYELIMVGELEGTQEGTFNVKAETRKDWIQYYKM